MKQKVVFLIPVFIIILLTKIISAQEVKPKSWETSLFINTSLITTKSDWDLTHPFVGGQSETITGTFKQSVAFDGGAELSKGKLAFRFALELIPQKLNKSHPVYNNKLNLLVGEFALVVYPLKNESKPVQPWISLGGGLLKATGDIDNSGLLLSYGAGFKIPLTAKLGINIGLKGMRLKYTQLEVSENISKDITINPVKIDFGVYYHL